MTSPLMLKRHEQESKQTIMTFQRNTEEKKMKKQTIMLKRNQINVTLTLKLDITTVDSNKELLEKLDKGFGVCYKGDIVNAEEELDEIIVGIIEDTMNGMFNEDEVEELIDKAHIVKSVYATEIIKISDLEADMPESLKK